jgi:hypothetical protein
MRINVPSRLLVRPIKPNIINILLNTLEKVSDKFKNQERPLQAKKASTSHVTVPFPGKKVGNP